jgi:NADH:ubiquinone oxidoreductase subunit
MSFLRGLFASRRVLVGADKLGNKYFLCDNRVREVETASRDPLGELRTPALWQSWLRHTRDAPPTQAELDAFDAQQQLLRLSVEEIERKDRKLRLQERAQGMHSDEDSAPIVEFAMKRK